MRNIAARIRSLVSNGNQSQSEDAGPFNFVKARKAILKELLIGQETGNILGLYSPALGDGMFLTGVEKVEKSPGGHYVILCPYDMSGHLLIRNALELDEIRMVCRFKSAYMNPFLTSTQDVLRKNSEATQRLHHMR